MALSITEVLNIWNQSGVFSYVLPFLLIFAVTFALLQKSGILAKGNDENKPLLALVAASIGLLALQFDLVSTFFATIFPRFGIGLSILLVILIFIGFLSGVSDDGKLKFKWMGVIIGGAVAIWAFISWDTWFYGGWTFGGSWVYSEGFWSLAIVGVVVWLIYRASKILSIQEVELHG